MWLFGRQHTPIELPDTPTLSRSDAEVLHAAGLTLREWDRLTEAQRADYRWRIGIRA
jgi:hypothetical protein